MSPDLGRSHRASHRSAESLLEQLSDSAIDYAYYEVDRETESSFWMQAFTLGSIVLIGFFLAVVSVQSQNDRPATETERQALIESIAVRQDTLESRRLAVDSIQTEIATLEGEIVAPTQAGRRDLLNAGGAAVIGDGVEVHLSSSASGTVGGIVSDLDVQLVVNGLWMSGAEAVDINGNRLSATSAIRSAGEGITVNFRSISEPVVIRAIGSQNALVDQFESSPSGRYLVDRERDSRISWSIREVDEISMSAAPSKRLEVSHASVIRKGDS